MDKEPLARLDQIKLLLRFQDGDDYNTFASRVRIARKLFHEEIADIICDPFNKELPRRPHNTLVEKQELARWANAEMRSLGIAIHDKKTGDPASLRADTGGKNGRFQIELISNDRGRKRTFTSADIFLVQLMPHFERREPLAELWADRVAQKQSGTSERK